MVANHCFFHLRSLVAYQIQPGRSTPSRERERHPYQDNSDIRGDFFTTPVIPLTSSTCAHAPSFPHLFPQKNTKTCLPEPCRIASRCLFIYTPDLSSFTFVLTVHSRALVVTKLTLHFIRLQFYVV